MALWDIFQNHTGRVIHKWIHYFPAYERHFSRYVGRPLTFLEIGCGRGGSLQMWKKYFGPQATIIGVDIKPKCKEFEEDQINVRIGSQSDTTFLASLIEEFGTPDIVLDDGSHRMKDVLASFKFLYPLTDRRGVYMVEDMQTSYWKGYGGGLRQAGTFIEEAKLLIDEVNIRATRGQLPETPFSKSTLSMHFYESMVVFEKGEMQKTHAPAIGGPPRGPKFGKKAGGKPEAGGEEEEV